jgi:hypothetical protein
MRLPVFSMVVHRRGGRDKSAKMHADSWTCAVLFYYLFVSVLFVVFLSSILLVGLFIVSFSYGKQDPGAYYGVNPLRLNALPHLRIHPRQQNIHHVILFLRGELRAFSYPMPLLQARPAARTRRVLRHKNGMSSVWRLLAVVARLGRGQPSRDEVARMRGHHLR